MPPSSHAARHREAVSTTATAASLRLLENGPATPAQDLPTKDLATQATRELSVRALNVLKLLAPELLGETPPVGEWTPPDALLRLITIKTLMTARNCGPQTKAEILSFAECRGVRIQPLFHSGKALQVIWRELDAGFAEGRIGKAEIAEALEKSVRRKSSRIPVAVQKILLSMLDRD